MKNLMVYIMIVATGLAIMSCKKYDQEFIGPPLGIAPDNFSVSGNSFTVSNSSPNFLSDSVYFQASFNASVNWTIDLIGQTSGATKQIKGFSNVIDVTNSIWKGTTDTTKLFRAGEKVVATLSIFGWNQSLSTLLTISQAKDHGFVLATFEGISVDPAGNFVDQGYYWYSSFDSGEKSFMNKLGTSDAPEGNNVLRLAGSDANANYYIGKAGLSSSTPYTFNFGTTNPDELYFNLYVKGGGASANVKLVIETFEDDNGDNNLLYDGSEDKYDYTIDMGFDGWKLISVKYSDFTLEATSSPYKDKDPEKIHLIGYYFGPKNASSETLEVQFDYPVITVGGPMIP